jgi:hypothetical protein
MKLFRFFNEEAEDVYFDKSKATEVAVNEFFDQTYTASLAESITLSDLVAGIISGAGNTYNETLAESIDVSDAQQAQLVILSNVAEAIDLIDTLVGSLIIAEALTQSIDVSDGLANTATLSATLGESIAVLDTRNANVVLVGSLAEAVSISDGLEGSLIFIGTLQEAILVQDALSQSAGASLGRIIHKLQLKANTLHATTAEVSVYTFNLKNFITTHLSDMVQTKKVDLVVRRGDTFNTDEFKIERALFDFTGTTARMQIKRRREDATALLQPTTTVDNTTGSATAKPTATAEQVAALPPNTYYYDVDFTLPDGSVYTYFEGDFLVK